MSKKKSFDVESAEVKFLRNFSKDDVVFSKPRTTAKSVLIDITNKYLFQTGWMEVKYDLDSSSMCLGPGKSMETFELIDDIVKKYVMEELEYSEEEVISMYKPIVSNSGYVGFNIVNGTVLFKDNEEYYIGKEIVDKIKKDDNIRLLISFKQIYVRDYTIKLLFELHQVELA